MKQRHKCDCCGYYTLVGTKLDIAWNICPVCFWENDVLGINPNEYSGANHMTLGEGRKNFIQYGVCSENSKSLVRPPKPNEM